MLQLLPRQLRLALQCCLPCCREGYPDPRAPDYALEPHPYVDIVSWVLQWHCMVLLKYAQG